MIMKEQEAAGVFYLCAKCGQFLADCLGLNQEDLRRRQNVRASGIDPMSTYKTYLDYTRSGKNPSLIHHAPAGWNWHLVS
jgi:hypothetical protein